MPFHLSLLALLALLVLFVGGCDAQQQHQEEAGIKEPVIGVDELGNLHINTTTSNATVFVNGRDVDGEVSVLVGMVASLVSQQEALSSRVGDLCRVARFSSGEDITTALDGANCVFAADLDADGDMDVLSTGDRDDKVTWYENVDGNGTFSEEKVIAAGANGASSVVAADLDGDGDLDVLSARSTEGRVAWHENEDGRGTFSEQKVITSSADGARSVVAADLDNDGDLDVLSASGTDSKVAWYENLFGNGTFSEQKVIDMNAGAPYSVFAADVDGDGDMDVLRAGNADKTIAWYENEDGLGTFGQQNVISTSADGAYYVFAADLDGDGDVDVLSASWRDDKIAWYENLDGSGNFSEQRVIATSANGARSVVAADLDGDGDLDLLSASSVDSKVAWYENKDGRGSFSEQRLITSSASSARSVFAADLDNDGDMDVLSASWYDDRVVWYENIC